MVGGERIGRTDPEIFRALACAQLLEELGEFLFLLLGPPLVVLEDAVMALLEVLAYVFLVCFGHVGTGSRAGGCKGSLEGCWGELTGC